MSNERNQIIFNEEQLFEMFTKLFDIVFLMKYVPPDDFRYHRVSYTAKKLASLKDEDIGRTIKEVYHQDVADHLILKYLEAIQKKHPITYRDRLNIDQEERYGESVLIPIEYKNDTYVVGLTRDITQVVQLESGMATDPITGLPYIETFINQLESKLRLKDYQNSVWNLVYLSFPQMSFLHHPDFHGSELECLHHVVNRIKHVLQPEDLVSRVSNNEFVVALHIETPSNTRRITQNLFDELNKPIVINNTEITLTPEIGTALVDNDLSDIRFTLKKAFHRMLMSKAAGEPSSNVGNKDLNKENRRYSKIASDLKAAIDNRELFLVYQPKLDLRDGHYNAEALIRWNHPELGMVSPGEFIPIAEQTNQIQSIGEWVIRQVCRDLQFFRAYIPDLVAAVNISPLQIKDKDFIPKLKKALKECQLFPSSIELEITESALLDMQMAREQFRRLHKHGFHVVLDDFGTSYSSLSHLKELSVQKIKIDKSFIMNMEFNQKDQQIAQMMIRLAKNLDLEVTAEGVEKYEHLQMLKQMGCTEIQGFYLSKPLMREELIEFFQEKTTNL
ncbi:MAG: EAL domain-containing protein [Bacillaceae bacterium]|nr:EAL domain-containing protein [Bacillaceae bacterium]